MSSNLTLGFSDLPIACIIGVYPEERLAPQTLYLDLQMEISSEGSFLELESTIDYAKVAKECAKLAQEGRFMLIEAYATGWFPMAADRTPDARIEWFSPNPRGILPLDAARFSSRLLRTVRQGRFTVTIDRAFERVMREWAAERDESF